jgi:hypothetical protein
MNIKQFLEFLQTLPQDATVQVLSHYRDNGYYMQGGSCSVEDFTSFCKAGNQGTNWAYGEHYELTHNSDGQVFLQLGVMDK